MLDRLPNLKLISKRSVCPHVDVPACTDNGLLLCSDTRGILTAEDFAQI